MLDLLTRRPGILRGLWLPLATLLAVMSACGDLKTPAFVDCGVTPDSLDFGGVTMGASADRTFTVTNGGSETLDGSIRVTCSDFAVVGSSKISIPRGATGTFTLRFTPRTSGSRACQVSIADCGTLTTTGQGLPGSAECQVSPTSLSFGTVTVGSSADKSFTITNTGDVALSGTVQETCADFSVVGSTSYDLDPSEQATFTVRFLPTSGGLKSCTIDTQGLCADVSVSGTGQAPVPDPVCAVSTNSLSFGTVTVGQSATRTFTVSNTGGGTLTGSVTESCPDFSIVGTSTYSLGGGEQATFTVRFLPTSAGLKSCTIDTQGLCADVSVSGTGQAPVPDPVCAVSTNSLSFGTVTVGQSATQTFTITNTGGGTLTGSVTESCPDFSIVGTSSYSLGGGEQATFTVRFLPTSAGLKNCTIDTQGLCADVSVSGTGQVPEPDPVCAVSTNSLSFGSVTVGQSATQTFTITNTGGGTLTGSVTEPCPDFSIVGTSSYSLGGGEQATFTVRFAPTSGGLKSCTIDTQGLCADVSVSGTGQVPEPDPVCAVSTDALSFGMVAVGQSATQTFTISNTGGGTLTGSVTESCPDFSIDGTSSYSLGGGEQATFTVRFTPLAGGDQSCVIATGAGCRPVTARGTGQIPAPSCQLDSTTFDFKDVTVGQTADRQVTVTNSGLGILSGTLTTSCADFAVVGTASYSLGAAQSATFTLRFAPTATGALTCTVDPGLPCGKITLKGRGVPPPECEVADLDYDFGDVEIGKHKDHTIDVRNVGGGQLCGTATESCDGFVIVGVASYCAIPGTPYHLKLRFEPTQAGSFECTVNPGAGCPAITVHGVGH